MCYALRTDSTVNIVVFLRIDSTVNIVIDNTKVKRVKSGKSLGFSR